MGQEEKGRWIRDGSIIINLCLREEGLGKIWTNSSKMEIFLRGHAHMEKHNFGYLLVIVLTLLVFVTMPVSSAFMNPEPETAPFTLTSPSFKNNAYVSSAVGLGCRGEDKSPALQWENPPAGTKKFSILFEDNTVNWIHWDISNIPASYTGLPAKIPPVKVWNDGIRQGAKFFSFRWLRWSLPS